MPRKCYASTFDSAKHLNFRQFFDLSCQSIIGATDRRRASWGMRGDVMASLYRAASRNPPA